MAEKMSMEKAVLTFRGIAPLLVLATLVALGACTPRVPLPDITPKGYRETGYASWYGEEFRNRITASGEPYQPAAMTAAHRRLPFGTRVRVTNLENRRSAVVRINDRGPFRRGRIIDLSRAAAQALGMVGDGVVRVLLEAADLPD